MLKVQYIEKYWMHMLKLIIVLTAAHFYQTVKLFPFPQKIENINVKYCKITYQFIEFNKIFSNYLIKNAIPIFISSS